MSSPGPLKSPSPVRKAHQPAYDFILLPNLSPCSDKSIPSTDTLSDEADVNGDSPTLPHRANALSLSDMADPFEVRMRFTSQLQHLNASVTSSQKAAHYALKYRDMDEDLHSCILEQLERVSLFALPFRNFLPFVAT
jgi:hypothetical protein